MTIPPDFRQTENPFQDELLVHHVGSAPVLLRSIYNAVEPYFIWCPKCGYKVPGSTIEAAVSNWNHDIADPCTSSDDHWVVINPPANIEWHHAGVSPVLYESTFKDLRQYLVTCPKCGLFLDGPEPLELINRWNAQMEAGPRCD